MSTIRFSRAAIVLLSGEHEHVVSQRVLCTRHGLIAGSPDDVDEPAWSGSKDVVGSLDMAVAGEWPDRPQGVDVERPRGVSAEALAQQPRQLPRAVLWSAVLRRAVEAHDAGAFAPCEVEVAADLGEAAEADALRACALAGLAVCGLNDGGVPDLHAGVLLWQARRPWVELKLATGGVLIARHTPLPAVVRFGRRYVGSVEPLASAALELVLGDEPIAFAWHGLGEFPGQQEFELSWGTDGVLSVDLLVDGAWRPLAPLVVRPVTGLPGSHAAVFWQMSAWREVVTLLQVQLLEAVTA